MAAGCGVDIIEIERVKDAIESGGDRFLNRIYTDREKEYCLSKKASQFHSFAARFAAKEAVSKALGTGFANGLGWKDIEILNDAFGKPYVELHGKAREIFEVLSAKSIFVSLSHCDQYAVAYAVID